jgi:glycine/D-amino acid oxidase-like deaminating enzyme
VNAAGLWAPEVSKMVGLEIPSIAHTHILYETIKAVEQRDTMLPLYILPYILGTSLYFGDILPISNRIIQNKVRCPQNPQNKVRCLNA